MPRSERFHSRPQALPHVPHMRDRLRVAQSLDRRHRRRHGDRAVPERSRDVDLRRSLTEPVVPCDGRQRVAVGDRLAPGAEVGANPERLPASSEIDAEARAHVVDDERRALPSHSWRAALGEIRAVGIS